MDHGSPGEQCVLSSFFLPTAVIFWVFGRSLDLSDSQILKRRCHRLATKAAQAGWPTDRQARQKRILLMNVALSNRSTRISVHPSHCLYSDVSVIAGDAACWLG